MRIDVRTTLAALFLLAASAGCAPKAEPSAEIAALREKAEENGRVRVIARIAPEGDVATPSSADMRASGVAAFEAAGAVGAEPLSENLPLVVAEVTPEQLDVLSASGQVDMIMEDELAFPTLAESGPLVQAPETWALGGRGAGQAVAILDTGVDSAHPFLAGRVVEEACFSTSSTLSGATSVCPNGESSQTGAGAGRPCDVDACSHGTHVAGIAAGRGQTFSGMAPDADIIAVQVFSRLEGAACGGRSPCVAAYTSDQIRALDYVLQLAAQRRVASINMSLGGGRSTTACDTDLAKSVIDQLRQAGVATVIASGNNGFPDAVTRPGCISTAVTVGATTKQDAVANFSNRGPLVDLLAPGVGINSSIPNNQFAAFSGTSMATPHVAGAFAAFRSLRPDASVADIERALGATGPTIGGVHRLAMRDAAQALRNTEGGMVAISSDSSSAGIAELAALPPDRPVRVLVRARTPAGGGADANAQAVQAVEAAARAAGIAHIERMGSQPIVVIEATPTQALALAQSSAVESVQVDVAATTQQ